MRRLLPLLSLLGFVHVANAASVHHIWDLPIYCNCSLSGEFGTLATSKVVLGKLQISVPAPATMVDAEPLERIILGGCARACGATLGGLTRCDYNCTEDAMDGWCCVREGASYTFSLDCSNTCEKGCQNDIICKGYCMNTCEKVNNDPTLFIEDVMWGHLDTCPKTCKAKQYIRETTLMLQSIALVAGAVAITLCAMVLMFSASPERRQNVKRMIFYIILALILMAVATTLMGYLLGGVL